MITIATHCADCGELLTFGMCPFAEPMRARLERAPINCGRTAAENTTRLRRLIAIDLATHRDRTGFAAIEGER
jgi:hypothetical protein